MDHSTSTSRRAFLRTTGAAGATLAAGAALAGGALPGVARAADATTTTVPTVKVGKFDYQDLPKKPTAADLELVAFAGSLARGVRRSASGREGHHRGPVCLDYFGEFLRSLF